MSLNSPRGAPTAPPPKPSPREIAQARDWLDDVLPDGARQEAKDLTKSTKTASTLALEKAGFTLKKAEAPVAAEPEVEHAHPSPRVAEPEESLELERKPSFFQRTAGRLRRGSVSVSMSFSKKKDRKGGAAKDGKRRDEDDEFYMGASGQVVLGHARSFYNRKSGRTPQKQKQPKPPARTVSGVRKDGYSGSPSPDGNKSLRDSLSDWLADVLPDGSRKSSDRKSGSPSERSKPKQPQLTASTAGWKSAGFVTQSGGQKAGAAPSWEGPSEGRGEISIGLDDSDRSLWSERSSARSRRGSQDAPSGT